MSIDIRAFKEGQRNLWSAGDYPDVAKTIEEVARVLVDRVGVRPGEEMLDVATGSGNVALPAAELGAIVTGVDLTPKLLDAARERAQRAGVQVRWIEGDAEEIMAKTALEPQGRWEALRADVLGVYSDGNAASDGSLSAPAEYLLTVARLPG